MPISTFISMPDRLVLTTYQVNSLAEAVPHEPQGIYTVARTFHGDQALLFNAHLDRLEESARLVHIPLHLDRARLRAALREMLHKANYPDAKFRITIPADKPDCIYLAIEPFQPVPEVVQQHGASVVTVPLVRQNPVAKTTDWMVIRRPSYERLPAGVYEGILVREDGALLEGMSCNFYGIMDGTLYTASDGVLAGITRLAVLQVAPEIIPVKLEALRLDDIPHLSEAMLTSSGRGMVPITMIDGHLVGDGHVGSIVSLIRERFETWTEDNLEPI